MTNLSSASAGTSLADPTYHIENKAGELTHDAALRRVLQRGVEINTVIDLGAAAGAWSRSVKAALLPHAHFHLIEAQPRWRANLEQCAAEVRDLTFTHAAIAEQDGEAWFQIPKDNPYGGRAYKTQASEELVRVPAVSIDSEVERHNLEGPYAIKFDIHGLEREVLNGAQNTLKDVNLIIVEMLNYASPTDPNGGSYFAELLAHVNNLGFQCVDIAEPMWRPTDGAFWQLDLLFVPTRRPEARYRGW